METIRKIWSQWPGALVGAIAAVVISFWSGFVVTSGSAEKIAVDRTEAALKVVAVEVLAPLCFARAEADPDKATKVADISAATGSQRNSKLNETGWATLEGLTFKLSPANSRALAEACGKLVLDANPV